jgi:flagellar basal-body rod protein FlgC
MGGPFRQLDIAATGLQACGIWLDAIAHNVANVSTTVPSDEEPFRASRPIFAPIAGDPGGGVRVVGMAVQQGDPALVAAPSEPAADRQGEIAMPVVDLASEMTDMILATRSYQANLRVLQAARERYEAAMQIGRRS